MYLTSLYLPTYVINEKKKICILYTPASHESRAYCNPL